MGDQEPCRFSLFKHSFLFIFSFPIQLFLFSQSNHPFLPFSTILSFPFHPSLPSLLPILSFLYSSILLFSFHPSCPSLLTYLFLPILQSFPSRFSSILSFPCLHYSSILSFLFHQFYNLLLILSVFESFYIYLILS